MKKRRALIGIVVAVCWSASFRAPDDTRVPVVVELFTSEGCSDCPPADRLLSDLQAQQPVDRARILILGEHVDYFNHDGWTDPFSSRDFTDRQVAYDAAPGSSGPYTPEMIVDGRTHFVGSNRQSALAAIRRAAEQPKPALSLRWASRAPLGLEIALEGGAAAGNARVLLAVTEDGLTSAVRNGENKGRQLSHNGVVRQLITVGKTDGHGSFRRAVSPKIDKSWRGTLRALVIVQRDAGGVIAAGTLDVN